MSFFLCGVSGYILVWFWFWDWVELVLYSLGFGYVFLGFSSINILEELKLGLNGGEWFGYWWLVVFGMFCVVVGKGVGLLFFGVFIMFCDIVGEGSGVIVFCGF